VFSVWCFRYYRDKLDTLVDFPLDGLDLRDFVLSPSGRDGAIYDLYAVSNHMGSYGGGHCALKCRPPGREEGGCA
jgi:ubiquitin carboxyl-terminal hydrolase 4/11/15